MFLFESMLSEPVDWAPESTEVRGKVSRRYSGRERPTQGSPRTLTSPLRTILVDAVLAKLFPGDPGIENEATSFPRTGNHEEVDQLPSPPTEANFEDMER